jgi:hypothetical protein
MKIWESGCENWMRNTTKPNIHIQATQGYLLPSGHTHQHTIIHWMPVITWVVDEPQLS